jgi:hypothetical protein
MEICDDDFEAVEENIQIQIEDDYLLSNASRSNLHSTQGNLSGIQVTKRRDAEQLKIGGISTQASTYQEKLREEEHPVCRVERQDSSVVQEEDQYN